MFDWQTNSQRSAH